MLEGFSKYQLRDYVNPIYTLLLFCMSGTVPVVADELLESVNGNSYGSSPGFDFNEITVLDLGKEFSGMAGYGLRFVAVSMAPGASDVMHSHERKPQIIYVLQGTLTEQRGSLSPVDYGPGDVMLNTKDITHILHNRTEFPTLFVYTSIKYGLDSP